MLLTVTLVLLVLKVMGVVVMPWSVVFLPVAIAIVFTGAFLLLAVVAALRG